MTGDQAQAVIDELQPNIIAMYEQGCGQVDDPLVTVIVETDGSKTIKGHDRKKLLGQINPKSHLHTTLYATPRGHFWCLLIEAKSGRIHSHEMKHVALSAPGASGLN